MICNQRYLIIIFIIFSFYNNIVCGMNDPPSPAPRVIEVDRCEIINQEDKEKEIGNFKLLT